MAAINAKQGATSQHAKGRRKTQTEIMEMLSKSSSANVDPSLISGMAAVIASMGVAVPVKATPAEIERAKAERQAVVPTLTPSEILLMALIQNPNEWFVTLVAPKRKKQHALYSLGSCFESTTRVENGKVVHYARYKGGALNQAGIRKVNRIREKLEAIRTAVEMNGTATIRKSLRRTSNHRNSGSVKHALAYPLNEMEQKFLSFVKTPNVRVLLSENSKGGDVWHAFRWKWQTKYGFDLSEIKLSQQKQPNGTFNIFGIYTPRVPGQMSDGIKGLVNLLESKPKIGRVSF